MTQFVEIDGELKLPTGQRLLTCVLKEFLIDKGWKSSLSVRGIIVEIEVTDIATTNMDLMAAGIVGLVVRLNKESFPSLNGLILKFEGPDEK